ncbi:restriction endonuclease subunit S [Streptococcus oricebi]|uniref:Restriction endonuclease subunit S n=1 Tax=Streptococcus oricebi TaxID=1547447 RepID=A0ABS5B1C7_9STRE|nr:restriction endonuclease subunit S [Streptococcus oricebi]MBP2622636.1 restriction endonuclease subunit S [Streptococcus oricebi]
MTKQSIPNIRFKEFNEQWRVSIVDDLTKRFDNLRVPITASERVSGETPYYGANGIQDYVKGFTHEGEYVLIAEDGANNLKNYPVHYVNGKVWVNNHAHVLSGNKDKLSTLFLKNRLQSINFEKYLVGGGRAKLNADILMKISLYLPSLPEQSAIGSLFATLDDLLSAYKDNLANYQSFKRTMLSKMFPKNGQKVPEIRLAGFEGEWEKVQLGDVLLSMKSGLSRELSSEDIGLPVIRANNISRGILDLNNNIKYWYVKDPKGANTANYLVHKNDILVNFINSEAKMGTSTIVSEEPIRDTIYTTNILKLSVKAEFEAYFIFLETFRPVYKNYIKSITKPAVNQASFTTVDFKKYTFLFPSLPEQRAIGAFFTNLDDLIASYQTKIENLETLKKKLLQEMFV